jgi:hypothetical protein
MGLRLLQSPGPRRAARLVSSFEFAAVESARNQRASARLHDYHSEEPPGGVRADCHGGIHGRIQSNMIAVIALRGRLNQDIAHADRGGGEEHGEVIQTFQVLLVQDSQSRHGSQQNVVNQIRGRRIFRLSCERGIFSTDEIDASAIC